MSLPTASPARARRPRFLRPFRLSTLLLAMLVVALLLALYAQRLREGRLQDAIAVYRNFGTEGTIEALERPIPLAYPDRTTLDVFLRAVRVATSKNPKLPKIPAGIPVFVDPIGLQEAERSLNARVERPPGADAMTLAEHLRRVLEPIGLGFQVKHGYLMITSKEAVDEALGDGDDPFLRYRDDLR